LEFPVSENLLGTAAHLTLWLEKKLNFSGWPDKLSPTVAGKRPDATPLVRLLIN